MSTPSAAIFVATLVPLGVIQVPAHRRSLRDVGLLAESIREFGLLHPITLTEQHTLIAGFHRLNAFKKLGWDSIPALILNADARRARKIEIAENLRRVDLTELERVQLLLEEKRMYEAEHPGTKQGGTPGKSGGGKKAKVAESATFAPDRFTKVKAAESNVAERTIQEDLQIAERLTTEVQMLIAGTALAKEKTKLVALSRLNYEQQAVVAKALLAGVGDSVKEVLATLSHRHKESEREATRTNNRVLVAGTAPIQTPERFQTIVLDPPWDWGDEGDISQFGRGDPIYATMPIEEIAALKIPALAEGNAHIYLWITNRSLPKGFALLEGWGFRYICALTWCKSNVGMGNYYRGSTEHVLFGVRGSLPLLRKDVGTWFAAPRGAAHSAKPDEFYALVESCSPGPWLEMFARKERPGWCVRGAEVQS